MSDRSDLAKDNEHLLHLLSIATTALRDLYMGYPHKEIMTLNGADSGLDKLLRELVTELRGRGINDDRGWDCDATEDIPVAEASAPGIR